MNAVLASAWEILADFSLCNTVNGVEMDLCCARKHFTQFEKNAWCHSVNSKYCPAGSSRVALCISIIRAMLFGSSLVAGVQEFALLLLISLNGRWKLFIFL